MAVGIDRAISNLFRCGSITSASALAAGATLDEGLANLDSKFHHKLGLHACLDGEIPLLGPALSSSMLDANGRLKSRGALIANVVRGRVILDEVARELDAQFEHLRNRGLPISHLDGHGHIHALPQIARILAELCAKYSVSFVRNSRETFSMTGLDFNVWRRAPISVLISMASSWSRRRHYASIASNTTFVGLLHSGRLNGEVIQRWLANARLKLPEGSVLEIMCHPGFSSEIPERYHANGYSWDDEYEALARLPELVETLNRSGAGQEVVLHGNGAV